MERGGEFLKTEKQLFVLLRILLDLLSLANLDVPCMAQKELLGLSYEYISSQ